VVPCVWAWTSEIGPFNLRRESLGPVVFDIPRLSQREMLSKQEPLRAPPSADQQAMIAICDGYGIAPQRRVYDVLSLMRKQQK
jgi:hypothetical protein